MSIAQLIDSNELKASLSLINKHRIPSPPDTILKLNKEFSLSAPDVEKIVHLVKEDIGLSSSILTIVNSSVYNLSREVTSLEHAIKLLGIKQLKHAIIQPAYKLALTKSLRGYDKISEHSNRVGLIATFIAEHVNIDNMNDPSLYYLAGLFHDCGTLILAAEYKDYMNFYDQNEHCSHPISCLERDKFGITHTSIAVLLAKKWGLPTEICNAIYLHHHDHSSYKAELDANSLAFTESLKLAHYLCYMNFLDYAEKSQTEIENEMYLSSIEELMLNEDQMEQIIGDIENM